MKPTAAAPTALRASNKSANRAGTRPIQHEEPDATQFISQLAVADRLPPVLEADVPNRSPDNLHSAIATSALTSVASRQRHRARRSSEVQPRVQTLSRVTERVEEGPAASDSEDA
eukprot:1294187-Amphidinium_carterae.2